MTENYHDKLKRIMDLYVHTIYSVTKKFPSVILNYIEGYARRKNKVNINFLEISYGSLQESKYLLDFSLKEGFIDKHEFEEIFALSNEIGAMLWKTLEGMPNKS